MYRIIHKQLCCGRKLSSFSSLGLTITHKLGKVTLFKWILKQRTNIMAAEVPGDKSWVFFPKDKTE